MPKMTKKPLPISKATKSRNFALLMGLIIMMLVFYGLGMTRINGGVGLM